MAKEYKERIYNHYVSIDSRINMSKVNISFLTKTFAAHNFYIKKHLPQDKQSIVLDIGCGAGGFVYYLQKHGYENARGIDVSQEQIAIGQQLGVKNLEKADLISYLDQHQQSFDVITMFDVIEHFDKEEVVAILEKVFTSLKSGGRLILRTVNGEGIFYGKIAYGDFTHETIFTAQSFEQVFGICGFRKYACYPVEPAVHGVKSFIRAILWKVIKTFLRLYLLIETGSPGTGIVTQNLIAVAEK
jgi:2-polyprenyl-3-methyl-5-hydroxy-6-metoxy-1,4-benzoquinol methylase